MITEKELKLSTMQTILDIKVCSQRLKDLAVYLSIDRMDLTDLLHHHQLLSNHINMLRVQKLHLEMQDDSSLRSSNG